MCSVKDCGGQPVAKGLCGKHYRRMLRTGDPLHTRRPGPQRTEAREMLHEVAVQNGWSTRTEARFIHAVYLLAAAGIKDVPEVIATCELPRGQLNVSKFLRTAELIAAAEAQQPES